MANNDATLSIGLDDGDLLASLRTAGEAVSNSAEKMQEAFEKVNGTIEAVTGTLGKFTAILAGGAAFKEIIESTGSWAEGALKLSKSLGVSTETASTYQIALKRLGLDNEVLISASDKLSKQVYGNSQAFQKLGVDTKDSNGNFRAVADIMKDVNEKLLAIPNTMERNIAGQQVYGKGWAEIRSVLKITSEALQEAEERGKALGLIVGPQGAAQAKLYKEGLNDVKLVGTALQNELGAQLLPTLTQLGAALADNGPEAASVFGESLKLVAYVGETVFIELDKLGKGIGALGAAAAAVLSGDLEGAKAIMNDLDQDIDKLNLKADTLWDNLHKPLPPVKQESPDLDGPMPFDSKEKDQSQLQALQEKLEAIKANYSEEKREQGSFEEFSKQAEIEYWQNVLNTTKLGTKDRLSVEMDINKLRLAADKQAYADELAGIKSQEAQYKNNLEAKLALAQEYAAKITTAEGGNSSHAKEAQAEVLSIEREIDEQRLALAKTNQDAIDKVRLNAVDTEEKAAQQRVANHQQTEAQLLAQERQFEAERLAITVDGLNAQIAAASKNPEENVKLLEQLNAQKIAAAQKYEQQLAALNIKAANEQTKDWKKAFDAMTSGFQSVVQGMLNGTETWKQAVQQMYKTITSIITSTISNMVTTWLQGQVSNLLASKTTAAGSVADQAAVAGAAAFASTAAIPYVGPELAPEAAAAAYAGALSFGAGLSARGGFDIPGSMNPIVQTHANEMILPEEHANTIRNISKNGGGRMDTRDLEKAISNTMQRHGSRLIRGMNKTSRRFS
jgi:hypothetical protein